MTRFERISSKSGILTALLCFFVGYLGIHRFYVGKPWTGCLQLLTGGGFGIWWIIDFIRIVFESFRDGEGDRIEF